MVCFCFELAKVLGEEVEEGEEEVVEGPRGFSFSFTILVSSSFNSCLLHCLSRNSLFEEQPVIIHLDSCQQILVLLTSERE